MASNATITASERAIGILYRSVMTIFTPTNVSTAA